MNAIQEENVINMGIKLYNKMPTKIKQLEFLGIVNIE